jgi:hypothetical protein
MSDKTEISIIWTDIIVSIKSLLSGSHQWVMFYSYYFFYHLLRERDIDTVMFLFQFPSISALNCTGGGRRQKLIWVHKNNIRRSVSQQENLHKTIQRPVPDFNPQLWRMSYAFLILR